METGNLNIKYFSITKTFGLPLTWKKAIIKLRETLTIVCSRPKPLILNPIGLISLNSPLQIQPSVAWKSRWLKLAIGLKEKIKKLSIATFALFVGSLIYVFWRSETLTMFIWFKWVGLASFVESLRNCTQWLSIYLPNWFLFSLPNALWLFSGILVFDSIWGVKQLASKLFWLSVFLIIAIGAEVGQSLRVIPGTFDWQDIALMILASFCAFLIMVSVKQEERRQEP